MVSETTLSRSEADAARRQAAVWSVLTRGVQAAASLVTVVLVGSQLDAISQGYFYSCLALIAFLPLAEFGASYAVMQSASHYAEGVRWTTSGLTGPGQAVERIAILLRIAKLWNAITTTLAVLLLAWLGTSVLQAGGSPPPLFMWHWTGLIVLAALWQLLAPSIAVLEGAGRVHDVWRFRLVQEVVAPATLAAALLLDLGLFSLVLAFAARLIHAVAWLRAADRTLPRSPKHTERSVTTYWRADVWPFQWRVGVSILCGFLIYYLFTPVIMASQGPVAAGQFGMSLALATGLQAATTAWVNSQAPHYGTLVAAGRFSSLDSEFSMTLKRSTLLVLGGALVMACGSVLLSKTAPALAARLLPPLPFGLLLGAAVANHIIFAFSVYLRAHRRDPLLIPSLIGASAMAIGIGWAARTGEPVVVAGMYFSFTVVGLAMALVVFVTCRRRWHLVHA